jgi:hypothetical protein
MHIPVARIFSAISNKLKTIEQAKRSSGWEIIASRKRIYEWPFRHKPRKLVARRLKPEQPREYRSQDKIKIVVKNTPMTRAVEVSLAGVVDCGGTQQVTFL